MIPKERAVAAIKREPVDKVPVVAICYGTHEFMKKAGAFWPDAHYDARKMVELARADCLWHGAGEHHGTVHAHVRGRGTGRANQEGEVRSSLHR